MQQHHFSRRAAMKLGSILALSTGAQFALPGANATAQANEVTLTDEPTIGDYGTYDLNYFGPPALRNVGKDFLFPKNAEDDHAYGIDISHHTQEVPWKNLKEAKVNYVYVKASQGANARDGKFVEFWNSCTAVGLPVGAYHFLTAGVSGKEQATYFIKRLNEVGGLKSGNLQPVFDLEWDTFGPAFKRVKIGNGIFKDYWDEPANKSKIVEIVNDCVETIIKQLSGLPVKPLIYTNKSWWDDHVPSGTVFKDATVWISDYRKSSYTDGSPRSVAGHDFHLWQFTETGKIHTKSMANPIGPFDCNKLVFGSIKKIVI